MTPYDDILDLALISIEDYKLNKLASCIEEDNYNLVIMSSSYDMYVETFLVQEPSLTPITKKVYDYIKGMNFNSYDEYVEDSMMKLKLVLEGFMIRGLSNFNNCKKKLDNRDDITRQFNEELNDLEKSILADYTVIMWLDKGINDVRQLTGMLQNKSEGRRLSEANLLKEKSALRISMREEVNKKQTDYSFSNVNWNEWADGKYEL